MTDDSNSTERAASGDSLPLLVGYTYPMILDNRLAQWIWAKILCPSGLHLFDEVWGERGHYLHCDACGHILDIPNMRAQET